MRELKVGRNDGGQRVDKFLCKALRGIPPALIYRGIRTKKIKVNRKRCSPSQPLAEGDLLQLFLPEDVFAGMEERQSGSSAALSRMTPRLSILYEDSDILLINKRSGISVHEDDEGGQNTLITHIQAYLCQKGEYRPEEEQAFAPALCNRIDRNTCGIVIAAKNAEALRVMNGFIRERYLQKYYLCAVHGIPSAPQAVLSGYLRKDADANMVRIYDKNPPRDAKEIRTAYRVLATQGDISLLEVELLTGRTHQIRAHLSHIGHPIVGDGKYGINRADRARGYKHQALCSYRLRFAQPQDPPTLFDHLRGREFSIPPRDIYFIPELFPELQ